MNKKMNDYNFKPGVVLMLIIYRNDPAKATVSV